MITRENYVGRIDFGRFNRKSESAKENEHKHWIDGIPVTQQFLSFIREVRCRWPSMVLCVDAQKFQRLLSPSGEPYDVYNYVGVASPDALHMRVGALLMSEDSYGVESKRIENEKFASHSDGYHIRKSKDMKKVLKIARQFIKPPTFQDVLNEGAYSANAAISEIRDPARARFKEKLNIDMNEVADEVANMVASGYIPATKSFREALDVLHKEGAELKRLKDYTPRKCFVWAKQNSLIYKFDEPNAEAVEITNLSDIPEMLSSKLAVLNVAEEMSAIPDVGVRVTNATYWVFV